MSATAKKREPKTAIQEPKRERSAEAKRIELGPDVQLGRFGVDVECRNRNCRKPLLPSGTFAFVFAKDHSPFRKGDHVCCACGAQVHEHMALRVDGLKKRLRENGYNASALDRAIEGRKRRTGANVPPARPRM